LIEALDDPDSIVRTWAVNALATLKCREAVPALVRKIRDPALEVANWAQAAVATIGDRRAIPLLEDLLSDKSHWTRGYAVFALGELGDSSLIPRLSLLSQNDPDPWVRDSAMKSLRQLAATTRPSQDGHD
jgi:HEAT repeat protein